MLGNIIIFKKGYYQITESDRKESGCTGCHWDNNLDTTCPSEEDVWSCDEIPATDDAPRKFQVLVKVTIADMLKKL